MIAEKVFAEGVARDIRNYLPPEYEDAEFTDTIKKNIRFARNQILYRKQRRWSVEKT